MNLKLTSLNSLLQKAELENENLNSKIEQAKVRSLSENIGGNEGNEQAERKDPHFSQRS